MTRLVSLAAWSVENAIFPVMLRWLSVWHRGDVSRLRPRMNYPRSLFPFSESNRFEWQDYCPRPTSTVENLTLWRHKRVLLPSDLRLHTLLYFDTDLQGIRGRTHCIGNVWSQMWDGMNKAFWRQGAEEEIPRGPPKSHGGDFPTLKLLCITSHQFLVSPSQYVVHSQWSVEKRPSRITMLCYLFCSRPPLVVTTSRLDTLSAGPAVTFPNQDRDV